MIAVTVYLLANTSKNGPVNQHGQLKIIKRPVVVLEVAYHVVLNLWEMMNYAMLLALNRKVKYGY